MLLGELTIKMLASDPAVPNESLLFQFTGVHSWANALVERLKVAGAFAILVAFLPTAGAVTNAVSMFRKSWNWWFIKYPVEEPFVRKQLHSSPLSFCAKANVTASNRVKP